MATEKVPRSDRWVPGARIVEAEGARIGFLTCKRCGVSVMLDPSTPFNVVERHEEYHRLHDK